MKVLMTADTVGGVWNYSLELAAALAAHDVELVIATMGAPLTPDQWRDAGALDNVDIVESSYRLEWMPDPWDDVDAAGRWLLALANARRVDLAHLNGYAHAALDWGIPTCVVAHSCVLSWWREVKGAAAPELWARYRCEVSAGLRAADTIVAPSTAMLAALEREYGALPDARVIYNGRAADAFHHEAKEQMVLSVGRLWDEAKNIAALEGVAPAIPWPVYIAGDCESPTGASGYQPSAHYLGRLAGDDLARWMARAAVYVLPALYEPFGLSALEAALAGCALVLGDIPSLRELWGGAALFVSPRDPDALRDTLRNVIADGVLRASVACACHHRALEFGTERMADNYAGVYQEMLAGAALSDRRVVCAS